MTDCSTLPWFTSWSHEGLRKPTIELATKLAPSHLHQHLTLLKSLQPSEECESFGGAGEKREQFTCDSCS